MTQTQAEEVVTTAIMVGCVLGIILLCTWIGNGGRKK